MLRIEIYEVRRTVTGNWEPMLAVVDVLAGDPISFYVVNKDESWEVLAASDGVYDYKALPKGC